MAVSINIDTIADPVGLDPAGQPTAAQQRLSQQRRPARRCANVDMICHTPRQETRKFGTASRRPSQNKL